MLYNFKKIKYKLRKSSFKVFNNIVSLIKKKKKNNIVSKDKY